jgi:hypothetical protein
MGLKVLEREKQVPGKPNSQPDLDTYTHERQLKPEA